jgi:hypothetical protein
MRTIATFDSKSFNTHEPKPYFINPCCFGDDAARWLIARLRDRGVEVESEPGQEDFGWYVRFRFGSARYFLIVGFRPDDESEGRTWIVWIERNRGLLASPFSSRGIDSAVPEMVHAILTGAGEVKDVKWYSREEFKSESDTLYSSKP